MEIDYNKCEIVTFPKNANFSSNHMGDCLQIINFFKEGPLLDKSLWLLLSKTTIKISEILPLLPFTILVKNLSDSERIFFIKNYSKIKDKANVQKINDWAQKNKSEIKDIIFSIGKPEYSKEEIKEKFKGKVTDEKLNKRILNLASQIVKNAQNFDML